MHKQNTRRGFTQQAVYKAGGSLTNLQATQKNVRFTLDLHPQPNGFTLIELLVVVLIIGILAAVALPQYQKAVAKARTVELISILEAGEKAMHIWLLANGYQEKAIDQQELDMQIPVPTENYALSFACSDIDMDCQITIATMAKSKFQLDLYDRFHAQTWSKRCDFYDAPGALVCNYLKQSFPNTEINDVSES